MKNKKRSVIILGSELSGKTCFFAGLGIVSEPDRADEISFSTTDKAKAYLHELTSALRGQTWPAPTSRNVQQEVIGWVHYRKLNLSLRLIDFSGEMFREIAEGKPLPPSIFSAIRNADYLLLAFAPDVDMVGDNAPQTIIDRLDALITVLHKQYLQQSEERQTRVAVIVTKADLLSNNHMSPPATRDFFANRLPNLYQKMQRFFPDLQVFSVSAVGATEKNDSGASIPSKKLNPWGYEQIFDWIISDIRARRRIKIVKSIGGLIAISFILVAIYVGIDSHRKNNAATEFNNLYRVGVTSGNWQDFKNVVPRLSKRYYWSQVDEILKSSANARAGANYNRHEAERWRYTLQALLGSADPYSQNDLQEHFSFWISSIENGDFNEIEQLYTRGEASFPQRAIEFLNRYPNSPHRETVYSWLDEQYRGSRSQSARYIGSLEVKCKESLRKKIEEIGKFLNSHPNVPNKSDIEKASSAANRLLLAILRNQISIELRSIGQLQKAAWLRLKIFTGEGSEEVESGDWNWTEVHSFEGKKTVTLPNWSPGDAIKVELHYDGGKFSKRRVVAEKKLTDGIALAHLAGKLVLDVKPKKEGYFVKPGPVLECTVPGFEDRDWKMIKDWISPGNRWQELAEHGK